MKEKVSQAISVITVPILLVIGTAGIYFFAKGYRIDIPNGSIEQTGVISVKSYPRGADVLIDGQPAGKTPRTADGVSIGPHTITIEKDGYHTWTVDVTVESEQLVPIEAILFLEEPEITTLFPIPIESDTETYSIQDLYADDANKRLIFTAMKSSPDTNTEDVLQVWSYPTERQFWQINVQPLLVAEFSDKSLSILDVKISPDGQKALLRAELPDGETFYLLSTNELNDTPTELQELVDTGDIPPTWSKSSSHILFSRKDELRNLDLETLSQSIITSKNADESFIWTTNQAGQVFYLSSDEETTQIIRTEPNGSGSSTVLEFPLIDSSRVLFPEGTVEESAIPEEPVGTDTFPKDISFIALTPREHQLILMSSAEIMLYSMDDETYSRYSADEPIFISFSPDEKRFSFIEEGSSVLSEFRFILDEGDPFHTIGPRKLFDLASESILSQPNHIVWHPESTNVLFSLQKELPLHTLSTIDTESLQLFNLTLMINETFSIDSSGKFLVGACNNEQSTTICRIDISE